MQKAKKQTLNKSNVVKLLFYNAVINDAVKGSTQHRHSFLITMNLSTQLLL